MTCVYMMIGPAGCGKSTVAEKIAAEHDAELYSSDAIREELFGDESIQGDVNLVFKTLYDRAYQDLKISCDVVIDATNLTRKNRQTMFRRFKNIPQCHYVAVIVKCPIEQAKKQNAGRSRHVPVYVIERQFKQYQEPMLEEGFEKIIDWEV